jgi:hypothetical protein
MGRRRHSSKKPPRGRPSFAKGSKKDFLEKFGPEFLEAHSQGHDAAGRFYDRVANSWLRKYGFDLPFNEDFEGPPPEDDLVDDPTNFEGLDDEEIEQRVALIKKLRKVSTVDMQERYGTQLCINYRT